MNIKLKSMEILNFKGIRQLNIQFNDITSIDSDNGVGKTSIMDAFMWCLFGKNSNGSSDFNIKTLDENNDPIHKLDHVVKLVLSVDGHDIKIERCYREKWQTVRGTDNLEMRGHETVYSWNEVPLSQTEFKQKIESICREDLFMLITSTSSFNSMPWQDRRSLLIEICGDVTDGDVAKTDVKYSDFFKSIDGKKSIDEYKAELSAKRKRLKDELKQYQPRIDEVERGKPEPVDVKQIQVDIDTIESEIKAINEAKKDQSKQHELMLADRKSIMDKIYMLKGEQAELIGKHNQAVIKAKQDSQSGISGKKNQLNELQTSLESLIKQRKTWENDVVECNNRIEKTRAEWKRVESMEFKMDENEKVCPTCKRPHENIESKIDEMREEFNKDKIEKLDKINTNGQELKKDLENAQSKVEHYNEKINSLTIEIDALKKEINEFDAKPVDVPEKPSRIAEIDVEVAELQKQADEMQPKSNGEFDTKISDLTIKRDELKSKLSINDQIQKSNQRIEELKTEEKNKAVELANIEKHEMTVESFIKTKVEMLEKNINSMFILVKFKMFKNQINGGFKETCEAMVNGVPFSDLNNASCINAGLDIINTLSRHFDVTAPIFVDNAEAVNELIPTASQLVTLSVSKSKTININ